MSKYEFSLSDLEFLRDLCYMESTRRFPSSPEILERAERLFCYFLMEYHNKLREENKNDG